MEVSHRHNATDRLNYYAFSAEIKRKIRQCQVFSSTALTAGSFQLARIQRSTENCLR